MNRREFITLLGGGAAPVVVWPLVARAQQMPVIGFMSARSPEDSVRELAAFHKALEDEGFVEGRNVAIEYRWARGNYDKLPALAAELVQRRVAVLLGIGGDASARVAKAATTTIPVVFAIGGDPVKAGLVESFNRPGANVTGITILNNQMEPKRLGVLHDLAPGAAVIGVLVNPNFPPALQQLQDLEAAARASGQQIIVAKASSDEQLETGFASFIRGGAGAVLVAADPYFDTRRGRIVALAAQSRLPAIYQFREYALEGGLISYGASITEAYRQIAIYTARILKGAKPADMPIMQPTNFELVINLKTARALGIRVSDNVLTLADEVIE